VSPVTRSAPPADERRVLAAWDANADAWTRAARGGAIPTRRITDEAIFQLVRQVPSGPVLDAGCGEGWLARRLAGHGHRVTGIDGSAALVARAQEAEPEEGGEAHFRTLTFHEAADSPRALKGPYGTVVFNFSLLEEKITPVLGAVAAVLFPYGRILIQTLHPAAVDGEYRDGWRTEGFPGLGFPVPIPFYFRTLSRWILELRRAGLILVETYEPLDPDTGRPVSLILSATIPEKRKS
jgi:2-polyprenyl-3-methyl-5-hydroxy-6-metoxy-1,4-benzoquinol methylase